MVTVLRYLDVLLIVLVLPFVVLAGLPVIGYARRRRGVDRATPDR